MEGWTGEIAQKEGDITTLNHGLTDIVRKELPRFIQACLQLDFDLLVPIGNETLSLVLPYVKKSPPLTEKIIPSESLPYVNKSVVQGKSCLVFNSTARTGKAITEIGAKLANLSPSEIKYAALFVQEGSEFISHLVNQNFYAISGNSYFEVKEEIIQILVNSMFIRFGDPPMWELTLKPENRNQLIETILSIGNAYTIPDYDLMGEWFRISIEDIFQKDVISFPNEIRFSASKIRLLVSKDKSAVKVLPLVFPEVVGQKGRTVAETLGIYEKVLGESYDDIRNSSSKIPATPLNLFRWHSAMNSLLLFTSFIIKLHFSGLVINTDDINIAAPIPDILHFSCSTSVFNSLRSASIDLINRNIHALPNFYQDQLFIFDRSGKQGPYKDFVLDFPYAYLSPEDGLMYMFSHWLVENEENNNNQILEAGMTLADLHTKADYMSPLAVSRALDKLIDEGVVEPRITINKNNVAQRTYTLTGETIRNRVRALGLAYSNIARHR